MTFFQTLKGNKSEASGGILPKLFFGGGVRGGGGGRVGVGGQGGCERN